MALQYNYLNLLEQADAAPMEVDPNNPSARDIANYTWLADGTKAQVIDQDDNGYVYLGSLIYKQLPDGSLELESTNHGSGRIVVKTDANGDPVLDSNGDPTYENQYHITDHLGSVRVVFNQNGEVLARNDFYPFGKSHNNTALTTGLTNPAHPKVNRFLFNGKEKQLTGNLGLMDYGARMYDGEIGRWHTADPLANVYYSQSPYSYCYNKPVLYIDPDGRFIESGQDKLDKQKKKVQERMFEVMGKMIGGGLSGWSKNINTFTSLSGTMRTIGQMESSATQGFSISERWDGEGGLSYNGKTNVINVSFSNTSTFVHEVEHVGQWFGQSFGFLTNSKGESGTFALDISDEVGAYQAQYAYDSSSVSGLASNSPVNSSSDITDKWVQELQNSAGEHIYAPGGKNMVSPIPLNVHSKKAQVMKAFTQHAYGFNNVSDTMPLWEMFDLHYHEK